MLDEHVHRLVGTRGIPPGLSAFPLGLSLDHLGDPGGNRGGPRHVF